MSEHTPGPWRVTEARGVNNEFCFFEIRREGSNQAILSTWPSSLPGDAPLAAAAPEMLALIRTTRCPGGGWNGMPERLEGLAEVTDCLAAGTCGCVYGDLVKKAEGRS